LGDRKDENANTNAKDAYKPRLDDIRTSTELIYSVPRTWAHTAIIPRNRVIEVKAAASSTTARNMMSSLNECRT
jgi:hypothetical protein